ncbi:hypothetical protein K470DRAFT_17979 [Piedraia hortae CBS 480.64]|uniref:RNI-like protein n=1 Tax=Piedraia hortae CBS 480.64 TaxID=1314780 RepID=A0A6A7C5K3_9PEZI|nr:hypothetical protein K470DRAFT_17979 [Piedraia hortae CBS 480.64]
MEVAPPSYARLVHPDPWSLIAPYLLQPTLLHAILVNRRLHDVLTRHLWGRPLIPNIEKLNIFLQILPTVRQVVREKTHTLYLPAADPYSLEENLFKLWLKSVLTYLPNLQSLLLPPDSPHLDHTVLVLGSIPNRLRYLSLPQNQNLTEQSLATFLPLCSDLLYLNLPHTPTARSIPPILAHLHHLQILNLSSTGLTDNSIPPLCQSIGHRLRSLNLNNNHITDRGASLLLTHSLTTRYNTIPLPSSFEETLSHALTTSPLPPLEIETSPSVGITHLSLASTLITPQFAEHLISSSALQALDLGSLAIFLDGTGVNTLRIGYRSRVGTLRGVGRLVLTSIPSRTLSGEVVGMLCDFLEGARGSGLRELVLEVVASRDSVTGEEVSEGLVGRARGDFTFFEMEEKEVDTIEGVRRYRKRGKGWEGRVVVQYLRGNVE